MKKWKCTVCGYIHTGPEPPEICPVCGADKSKFVEVTEAAGNLSRENQQKKQQTSSAAAGPAASGAGALPESALDRVLRLIVKHHAHPITVHIPNGVVPVSVLFLSLAVVFGFLNTSLLARVAHLNLLVVLMSMPVVIFTGLAEWRLKYNGALTTNFIIKIICSVVVTLLSLVIIAWFIVDPEVAVSGKKWLFLLLNFILLGTVGIAGHIGGKLVFKD